MKYKVGSLIITPDGNGLIVSFDQENNIYYIQWNWTLILEGEKKACTNIMPTESYRLQRYLLKNDYKLYDPEG